MKIFDYKSIDTEKDIISIVVDNNFDLISKIDLLINSFKEIKLINNGFELLVSTFMNKLNYDTYIPRKGDVNERFDLSATDKNNQTVIIEIEVPTISILDSPRMQLENISYFHSRRSIKLEKLVPLVICWDLPNNRTDYWNVVLDIEKITTLKIRTLSLPALALLYWLDLGLNFENDNYYLFSENNILHELEEKLLGLGVDINDYSGYFRPIK